MALDLQFLTEHFKPASFLTPGGGGMDGWLCISQNTNAFGVDKSPSWH
jgi:hypothetical protein